MKLAAGAHAVGRTRRGWLRDCGVEATALLRNGIRSEAPAPGARLRAGDTLVLFGAASGIETAENRLLSG